jgi:predicted RNA binding protein YcfA (HicA-like mRNA interferase family)
VEYLANFSEVVRLLREDGSRRVKEKGSIRYHGKDGGSALVRVDYHGSNEDPNGTCHFMEAATLS